MQNPPETLDGATVLKMADLATATPTCRAWHEVGGEATSGFAALALARYPDAEGIYRFSCDAEWNVMTDTYHDDVASAIAQAEFEFGDVEFVEAPCGAELAPA